MKEIDLVVLKYALCVGWIDLANYGEIVKAVEHLKDIEDTRASKFPAVFYGLGSAYYKLNRYVFSFMPVRSFSPCRNDCLIAYVYSEMLFDILYDNLKMCLLGANFLMCKGNFSFSFYHCSSLKVSHEMNYN
jgi:hypothetical protein